MRISGFRLSLMRVNLIRMHTLTLEVLKSSEIEGEILDKEQVRSSIARRLGMDMGALMPVSRVTVHRKGAKGAKTRENHHGRIPSFKGSSRTLAFLRLCGSFKVCAVNAYPSLQTIGEHLSGHFDSTSVLSAWGGENPPELGRYFQPRFSLDFFTENRPVSTVIPACFWRESSPVPCSLDSRQKHAGMTKVLTIRGRMPKRRTERRSILDSEFRMIFTTPPPTCPPAHGLSLRHGLHPPPRTSWNSAHRTAL